MSLLAKCDQGTSLAAGRKTLKLLAWASGVHLARMHEGAARAVCVAAAWPLSNPAAP